ncbi:MAG: hypothetical protein J6T10_30675 [Methanobrevibacter sp.]|nr:hypothetical protein [Methanobrevibacter sp.]
MAINVENVASFKFIAHKVMPLVYDESLSYYEFLCKVMKKLNEVISSLDNQNDILQQFDSEMQSYELELDGKFEQFERDMNALFDQLAESEVDARELFEKQIKEDFYTFASSLITPYDELLFPVYKGTYCWYEDACYIANQDIEESEEWDSTKWNEVVFAKDINDRMIDVELAWEDFLDTYEQNWNIVQETGDSEEYVMSQKAVTDELNIRAKVDGAYPELLAGDFISNEKLNSNPYVCVKRITGEGLEYVGNRSYPAFIGATVKWNQLVVNGNFDNVQSGQWSKYPAAATVSYSNNVAELTRGSSNSAAYLYQDIANLSTNHKYYISCEAKTDNEEYNAGIIFITTSYASGGNVGRFTNSTTDFERLERIVTPANSTDHFALRVQNGGSKGYFRNVMCIDLTEMFGADIADYLFSLEISGGTYVGGGVAKLKEGGFCSKVFYKRETGKLESVCIAKRRTYSEYDELIGDYDIDDNTELRGFLSIDESGNWITNGDKYIYDGTITRNFGIRDYASGDEDLPNVITDGIHTVYELDEPTTDEGEPFEPVQVVAVGGSEIIVDGEVGGRDVTIPCGYDIKYSVSVKQIIEDELPIAPTTDGTYTLKCTVADGVKTFEWVSE